MTTVDEVERNHVTQGSRWRLLVAMLVYAAGISFFQIHSMVAYMSERGGALPGAPFELLMAGTTFISILAYAIGFLLLAILLDIWTGRSPQPLAALNLALPAVATLELLRMPLLLAAFQVWLWATALVS